MIRALVLPCFLISIASAQVQQSRDPMLQSLEGTWAGWMEIDGKPHPCEATYAFALNGAFLEGTLAVYHDATRRAPMSEERHMLSVSDEGRIGVYVFSSRGVTLWGSWTGAAKSWIGEMQASDGAREASTFEWTDASHFMRTITLLDAEGQVVSVRSMNMARRGGSGKR